MRNCIRLCTILGIIVNVCFVSLPASFTSDKKQQTDGEQQTPLNKKLKFLTEEKQSIQQKESLDQELQRLSQRIESVREELQGAEGETETFLELKLSVLTQMYQHMHELAQARERIIVIIDEHIQLLEREQGQTEGEKQQQRAKTAPGYDTLRDYGQKVHDTHKEIQSLEKSRRNLRNEMQRQKSFLQEVKREYQQKSQQQASFGQGTVIEDPALQKLRVNNQGEIIDLQVQQLQYKQELVQNKIREDELRLNLIDTKIQQANETYNRLKNEYSKIKDKLNIDPQYVEQQKERLEKKRQEFTSEREKLYERLRVLVPREERLQDTIKTYAQQQNIQEDQLENYREWNKEPESNKEWRILGELGSIIAEKRHVQAQRRWIEAQVERENIKWRHAELNYNILQTWYKLTQRAKSLASIQELNREIQDYESQKIQASADLAELQDKRDTTINALYRLNLSLDNLKQLKGQVEEQGSQLLGSQQEHKALLNKFQKAETELRKHIDLTAKLVEVYSTSIATLQESLTYIGDIIQELNGRVYGTRSEQSISVQNLQQFAINVDRFVTDMQDSIIANLTSFNMATLTNWWIGYTQPYTLVFLIVYLVLLLFGYVVLRRYLPVFIGVLNRYEGAYASINILCTLSATMLRFVTRHLLSLYIWTIVFSAIVYGVVPRQMAVIFYLVSIPYTVYMAYLFFDYFMKVNRNRGYVFISQDYQTRFKWILPSLMYATFIITLFRQAFLLAGYYDYQILLALNFILLQIALICLISKEQVLSLISGKTPLWNWIEEQVNRYYYILLLGLITVIVMSNPFVGYGHRVLPVFSRILITLLLLPIFSWLHDYIKRTSSDLFFYYSEGDTVKERFAAGRTWYGVFVIMSFVVFVLFGLMIAAYVWGYTITLDTLFRWVTETRLYTAGFDEKGREIEVTVSSLIWVLLWGVGGMLFTYIINRFILRRIFDPLFISVGVQNTIITLIRYIIVLIALLIGFQKARLTELEYQLAILIGLLAYAMKEPVADVISYFIILVQRPVKVGDLIRIDSNITGIVRQINPRSTIVRYRNSTTYVVPNSQVITKAVQNWHYTRTFSAFEDILITVPYDTDPDHVRDLIFQVLDENINVLKNPRPIVRLENFVENGFEFRVRGFITADKILSLFDIASQVRLAIVRKLRTEGIPLAVPTRVLQITSQLSRGERTQHPASDNTEQQENTE